MSEPYQSYRINRNIKLSSVEAGLCALQDIEPGSPVNIFAPVSPEPAENEGPVRVFRDAFPRFSIVY